MYIHMHICQIKSLYIEGKKNTICLSGSDHGVDIQKRVVWNAGISSASEQYSVQEYTRDKCLGSGHKIGLQQEPPVQRDPDDGHWLLPCIQWNRQVFNCQCQVQSKHECCSQVN